MLKANFDARRITNLAKCEVKHQEHYSTFTKKNINFIMKNTFQFKKWPEIYVPWPIKGVNSKSLRKHTWELWDGSWFVHIPCDGCPVILPGCTSSRLHAGAVRAAYGGVHDRLDVPAPTPQPNRAVPAQTAVTISSCHMHRTEPAQTAITISSWHTHRTEPTDSSHRQQLTHAPDKTYRQQSPSAADTHTGQVLHRQQFPSVHQQLTHAPSCEQFFLFKSSKH